MKTITLTGMMGAGKTSAAKLLSEKLNCTLIDIDKIIETEEKSSISDIFVRSGEKFFREIEKNTILKYAKPENQIIAIGGGAFENQTARTFLLEISTVIYLKTSPEVIYERINSDLTRPLLKNNMNIEQISNIVNLREKNYQKAAYTILTDKKTIEEVVLEITGVI